MEAVLKERLKTSILTPFGRSGGGCINEGRSYSIDDGSKIYVKYKADKTGARRMFDGEFASLEAIRRTGQIRVPEPTVVEDYPDGKFVRYPGIRRIELSNIFVADGINSVGDYNSFPGGCRLSVCLCVSVCPHFFSRFTMG